MLSQQPYMLYVYISPRHIGAGTWSMTMTIIPLRTHDWSLLTVECNVWCISKPIETVLSLVSLCQYSKKKSRQRRKVRSRGRESFISNMAFVVDRMHKLTSEWISRHVFDVNSCHWFRLIVWMEDSRCWCQHFSCLSTDYNTLQPSTRSCSETFSSSSSSSWTPAPKRKSDSPMFISVSSDAI